MTSALSQPFSLYKENKENMEIDFPISYSAQEVIGIGSFGIVFKAIVPETSEVVAIKKVSQDFIIKTRELEIFAMLDHVNIIRLKKCFHSSDENSQELYLNLVMEYLPTSLYSILRNNAIARTRISMLDVKLYSYQLCRALHYCHSLNVCHRDVKPQNLLVDPENGVLKLCDFGSAKILVEGEPNVSYVSSRFYRAPELIFGSTNYTVAIDIWSAGCVIAELALGRPLFPGDSSVTQLVEIFKVLGTPTQEDIASMNSSHTNFRFPFLRPVLWRDIFSEKVPIELVDLISKMLVYNPQKRLKPFKILAHPFFDELRTENKKLPNGKNLPPLFNFDEHEYQGYEHLLPNLIPEHTKC